MESCKHVRYDVILTSYAVVRRECEVMETSGGEKIHGWVLVGQLTYVLDLTQPPVFLPLNFEELFLMKRILYEINSQIQVRLCCC